MDSATKIRVGVIFGGMSAENEVSLATGRYVYSLIDQSKYIPIALYMTTTGHIYHIPDKLVIQNKTSDIEARLSEANEIRFEDLKTMVDLMFIALLGKYGEDGVIQGLLELLKIPYTGSGILPSAVGMHKGLTKRIMSASGVLVARDVTIDHDNWNNNKDSIVTKIETEIGYPVVAKPTREGSSVGVSFANNREQLIGSIEEAFKYDKEVIVEEFIKGVEFMCVVLGNENAAAMTPSEVVFDGPIHTYESKYMPGKANFYTPPRVAPEIVQKVRDISVKAYKTFGMKGYGRVDGFIVDDKVIVSEVHTGTIMVPSSYVFQQVSRTEITDEFKDLGFKTGNIKAGGMKNGMKVGNTFSPRRLITTIIDLAIDAHYNKKGTLQ